MALLGVAQPGTVERSNRAFFSPSLDFMCLGGGSLLLLPILVWAIPDSADVGTLYLATLLAHVINHPHFAHSYQIFYRTFRAIVADPSSDRVLYLRYLWAGVAAPILIALFFAAALMFGDERTLGYAGNAMAFFVGWHYVKQGYGMLMVDAALRRSYFSDAGKKMLQVNAYACWIFAWLAGNKAVEERDFWGLGYASFDVPVALLWIVGGVLVLTTAGALLVLLRHARACHDAIPVNGIAGYVAALYPWLLMSREPVLGALIPALHSLQYLLIVWRYELNVEQAKPDAGDRLRWLLAVGFAPTRKALRFADFVFRGTVLGALGLWILPTILSAAVPYDLFLFIVVIFINIHHYFIDNAMWRKENPHTLRHLFPRR